MLGDSSTTENLRSPVCYPTQAALDSLMDQVGVVRVFRGGSDGDKIMGNDVVLETVAPADVASIRMAMRIIDGSAGHCMCHGGPTLELLSVDLSRLALVSIHHGVAIRWNQWNYDARLVDGRFLLGWLAERGVAEPLREFEAMETRQRRSKQDWDRWLAAMPRALGPVWSSALGPLGLVNIDPLSTALELGLPDEGQRVLSLLEWFGSGAGPWTGFPSYEQAAEKLLLKHSTAQILQAVESVRLSPAQLEGAARLFANGSFSRQRPEDLKQVPHVLRGAILRHIRDTQDGVKLRWAIRAFASWSGAPR
jgi:hypothetical protein